MSLMQRIIALVCFAGALMSMSRTAEAGYAHFIYDVQSGKVLASQNAEVLNHPASLAKMMTLYLAFEAVRAKRMRWDDQIVMTANAASKIPFKLGIGAGKTLTVREAVNAIAIRSANDAAAAMGDHLGGSEERFAELMTRKARQLGMSRTVFRNASGLPDPAQVTTARDLAVLAMALIRDYPQEYRLFSQRSFDFRGRTIRGHNNLMYRYPGMDGIKTGFVNASGYNLASAVNINGRRYIGVIMGGKSARQRDDQMAALLDQVVPGARPAPAASVVATRQQKREAIKAGDLSANVPMPQPRQEIAIGTAQARVASATGYAGTPYARAMENVVQQGGGDWEIQIAAASSQSAAAGVIDSAMPLMAEFGRISSSVQGSGSRGDAIYRARLSGFPDRVTATRACSVLKTRSIDCFVLR